MPLIKLDNAHLSFGHIALLDGASLQLDVNERVCLVGRNGVGKSSLMRVIHRDMLLDDGVVWYQSELKIAYLEQEVPTSEAVTVFDVVAAGLDKAGQLLSEYHHLSHKMASGLNMALGDRMAELQQAIDACDGWRLEQRVEAVLSKLELEGDAMLTQLSGGYKRRVMLAQALVSEPDLLLLDEPTNHLDMDSITWLEEFLLRFNGALLFITHDRTFLRHMATRIVELDRGSLTSWPGDYDSFLQKKTEQLAVEERHNQLFDKKLAEEEAWIRQGIKARRTRNEGRVRALKALRQERQQRRDKIGKVNMQLDTGEKSGKLVIEAENISKSFDGNVVIKPFSITIVRGDRVGVIGPNGAGKSTLLKLLLGELAPDHGEIRLGTQLKVAYFDQQRAQLDPEKTVMENLNLGSDTITINGSSRHVIGYLQDFLFPPQRARSPVKSLSGGERNRLLLARLFTQPANLLVLDEPTNDLDIETLELLETLLSQYDGTIIAVSHDRAFLDNVVTSTLVFEGEGHVGEYVGGYEDWLRQCKPAPRQEDVERDNKPQTSNSKAPPLTLEKKRKLNYKEQRDLKNLPDKIEALETEQEKTHQKVNHPDFYRGDKDETAKVLARLEEIDLELEKAYQQWEELM